MSVGRRRAVHRVDQVEHLHDAPGTQVEVGRDQFFETRIAQSPGPEGTHRNRGRLRHADRVGHLDLAAAREARRDQVLGDISCRVRGRAVDFRRVLARERAAAVARHAAVGVDDNLAPGQAAIADGAADHEPARRIDVVLRAFAEPARRQHRLDDLFHDGFVQVFLPDLRCMLGRQHDGLDADGLVVLVGEGQLALRVGAKPGQFRVAALADLRLPLDKLVRIVDRRRHQGRGLIGRITEHQALIARALVFRDCGDRRPGRCRRTACR